MRNEIEAARIAADAAVRTARIQVEWTATAGFVAIVGGLLVIVGAVIAAARQVRLDERKHKARATEYRVRMKYGSEN
jgi:hypothetical protein